MGYLTSSLFCAHYGSCIFLLALELGASQLYPLNILVRLWSGRPGATYGILMFLACSQRFMSCTKACLAVLTAAACLARFFSLAFSRWFPRVIWPSLLYGWVRYFSNLK